MDNRLSLQEYLSSYKTDLEKRQVFYAVFEEMHRFHNNGEYLTELSFQTVSVCFTNPTDIHFSHYKKIGTRPIQEVLDLKFQNILLLSQMMISSFLENGTSRMLCLKVIKENLPSLKKFLASDDYPYFERVFLQKEYLYYDDYMRELSGDERPFLEKRSASTQEQAFTTYLLLAINLVVVTLILACIFLYLPR